MPCIRFSYQANAYAVLQHDSKLAMKCQRSRALAVLSAFIFVVSLSVIVPGHVQMVWPWRQSESVKSHNANGDIHLYVNTVGASVQHMRAAVAPLDYSPNVVDTQLDTIASAIVNLKNNDRPNFVFMLADDLGYGDLHYTGSPAETPHLDAMATGPNSIQLTRCYAGAPVCSPTRGTVLTGRNHNRYCMWTANIGGGRDFTTPMMMPLPTSEKSVATILRKSGYQTGIFGKWHIGDLKFNNKTSQQHNKKWPVSHPGMHGFDKWWVTERSAPTANINCGCFREAKCITGHYGKARFPCTNYHTLDKHKDMLRPFESLIEGDDSHFIAKQFEQFLQETNGKPFFAYLPFHTAHHRYVATKQYVDYYIAQGMTVEQADYFGAITAMDVAIGQIRQTLKKYNVVDNTMLWFTSDNGPERDTPGRTGGLRGRKRDLYEGGIRVPGIIEWPAMIKRNRVSDFPVVSNDFLPTVCDILGVEPPNDRPIDGTSILPFIREETSTRLKTIAWAYRISNGLFTEGRYQAALSNNRYKVHAVYSSNEMIQAELYDLQNDHGEKNDLATDYPEILNSMKEELEEWRQSVIRSARDEVQCLETTLES